MWLICITYVSIQQRSALFYRDVHIENLDLLLLPFETDVWIATAITFGLIVTVTIAVSKIAVATIGAQLTVASSLVHVGGVLLCQGEEISINFVQFLWLKMLTLTVQAETLTRIFYRFASSS